MSYPEVVNRLADQACFHDLTILRDSPASSSLLIEPGRGLSRLEQTLHPVGRKKFVFRHAGSKLKGSSGAHPELTQPRRLAPFGPCHWLSKSRPEIGPTPFGTGTLVLL